jgi:hypothetical protein
MADQITFKEFDTSDVVSAAPKLKYFPAWSDTISDSDTTQTAIINSFYVNTRQTGSFEGLYYWNVYQENPATVMDTPAQFSIAWATTGSVSAGVPVGIYSANTSSVANMTLGTEYQYVYPSWAIYRQMVNATTDGNAYTLLTFSSGSVTYIMENVFVIALQRSRIKDYMDAGTWQLNLSGSSMVNIIASSSTAATNQTAYNLMIGTASGYSGPTDSSLSGSQMIGRFYSDKGLILIDADILFANGGLIQHPLTAGKPDTNNFYTASLVMQNFMGALVNTSNTVQAGVLASASSAVNGSYFKARSVERVQSTHYFVRAKNNEFNNSTNPTWVSGSSNEMLTVFYDDPKTFITSIGLYDGFPGQLSTGQLVALAKLSKPIPKDSTTEALVKVRLDFVWFLALIPAAYHMLNTFFA